MDQAKIVAQCKELLAAYRSGALGETPMPEDTHPDFSDAEEKIAYFTLPMALNYQRDSYSLWKAALATFEDGETRDVFDVQACAKMPEEVLREKLLKHKVALQPNKHVATWGKIVRTVAQEWGSFGALLSAAKNDYLHLKELVQKEHKKGFPYLSGPKIFNYWSYILGEYAGVSLAQREFIEIAPDTHVTQCSVRLGVLDSEEAAKISKEGLSSLWRDVLDGSGIAPIDMHSPLWFWSRSGFVYELG